MITYNGYKSDFARRHFAAGYAVGLAKARAAAEGRAKATGESVLLVLDSRGIAVTDAIRERVTSSRDRDELDTWLRRAAVVDRAEDIVD